MLETWGLTNLDFGVAFATYGITAMVSYLIGGPLADKYHPRHLISASLVLTAVGGIYLALNPSRETLISVYGFFGVSTILLLWGALIKTTHIAGGEDKRALAMALLDSGRGVSAAVFASSLVLALALVNRTQALTTFYFMAAGLLLVLAVGIWFALRDFKVEKSFDRISMFLVLKSLHNPNIWLLSLIVLGAYCGYKAIDNYSIYLVDVKQMDMAHASLLTSFLFWLRPVTTLITGVIADQWHRKDPRGRFFVLFVLLFFGGLSQMLLPFTSNGMVNLSFTIILFSSAFAYALRAVYFSVFGILQVPNHLVGTSIGIVSFVGFLPDVFYGAVTGYLIDTYAGAPGFHLVFNFTAACFFIGAIAVVVLLLRTGRAISDQPQLQLHQE